MVTTETWIIPIITLILTIITWAIIHHKKAQINREQPPLPPGPKPLPILGNLLSLDPQLHTYFHTLAQFYGPIFSLHLGHKLGIIISSPPLVKQVLKDHDVIFANRDVPAAGRAATYGGLDIVWSPYGATWRLLRKVCVRELLSSATLDGIYELRRREIRGVVGKLSEKVGTEVVNVGEEMFGVVMKVVTRMLWGGSGGDDVASEEEREKIGAEFRAAVMEFTGLLGAPNISDFYNGLGRFDLQGIEKRMRKCATWLDGIFEKVIDQRLRFNGEEKGKDFLEVCLRMKEDFEGGVEGGDEVEFSMKHIKALLMDMVVGGTDTTSNTIEFTMAELMNNPEVMKKVQQELDTVIGKDNIVEEHHIYKLPYLQAVMKESLRIHPVLPLLVPHCPSESCIVGGYSIPKGSRVFINVWTIHRDPSIWADPNKFDPDRFLDSKFDFSGNNFNFIPFGSGRRICAGIAMGERMVLYSLASLLHSFDWKLPKGEELDLEEKFGIVLSKKIPLRLIPERRLSNSALYE